METYKTSGMGYYIVTQSEDQGMLPYVTKRKLIKMIDRTLLVTALAFFVIGLAVMLFVWMCCVWLS